jgi:hypothetical protein
VLAELKKHAATNRALRQIALNKEAGVLSSMGKAVGRGGARVAAWGLKNPVKAVTGVLGGVGALGAARTTYNNMRPEVLRNQLGMG